MGEGRVTVMMAKTTKDELVFGVTAQAPGSVYVYREIAELTPAQAFALGKELVEAAEKAEHFARRAKQLAAYAPHFRSLEASGVDRCDCSGCRLRALTDPQVRRPRRVST